MIIIETWECEMEAEDLQRVGSIKQLNMTSYRFIEWICVSSYLFLFLFSSYGPAWSYKGSSPYITSQADIYPKPTWKDLRLHVWAGVVIEINAGSLHTPSIASSNCSN